MNLLIDTNVAYYLESSPVTKEDFHIKLDNYFSNYEKIYISELSFCEIICSNKKKKVYSIFEALKNKNIILKTFFINNYAIIPNGHINLILSDFVNIKKNARNQRVVLESEMLYNYSLFLCGILYFPIYEIFVNINDRELFGKLFIKEIDPIKKPNIKRAKALINMYYRKKGKLTNEYINQIILKILFKPILNSIFNFYSVKFRMKKSEVIKNINSLDNNNSIFNDSDFIQRIVERASGKDSKVIKSKNLEDLQKGISQFKKEFVGDEVTQFNDVVAQHYCDRIINYLTTLEKMKKNDIVDSQYFFYLDDNCELLTFDKNLVNYINKFDNNYRTKIDNLKKDLGLMHNA